MDHARVLERLYEHLENDDVEKAVMACTRLARATRDYLNAAIFLRELYPEKQEVARVLLDDVQHLKPEAQTFLWKTSLERWLELHNLDFVVAGDDDDPDLDEGDRRTVLKVSAGEVAGELEQWQAAIADLAVPPGLPGLAVASFNDIALREKAQIRQRIKALQIIKARLKTRCLNYAIQIERQLDLQARSQGFLDGVQNAVHNHFKARSDDVFLKLQKATQLALSPDLEDAALLLTEVRRALKAAADHFYPPTDAKVRGADGVERAMGEEQYLNRLQQFVTEQTFGRTAKDLLRAEIDHLAAFLRRLNEVASKGVHGQTTLAEARQGLVSLYFVLFNLCQHLSERDDPDDPAP